MSEFYIQMTQYTALTDALYDMAQKLNLVQAKDDDQPKILLSVYVTCDKPKCQVKPNQSNIKVKKAGARRLKSCIGLK